MKTLLIRNLVIQIDADQITGGDDTNQAIDAVDLINTLLRREPHGLGAQIMSGGLDDSDVEATYHEGEDFLAISKEKCAELQAILDSGEVPKKYDKGDGSDEVIETLAYTFEMGEHVHINICRATGNHEHPYINAILYDREGKELMHIDDNDILLGIYYFATEGLTYTLVLEVGE